MRHEGYYGSYYTLDSSPFSSWDDTDAVADYYLEDSGSETEMDDT